MNKIGYFYLLTALVSLFFSSMPVLSLPTGVSSHTGPIFTKEVLGYANVTSLMAYNATADCPYGATLQLNVMLMANTSQGNTYYFWLQNVASFITNESEMNFCDNVWNVTTPIAQISNVSGKGSIYTPLIINPFSPQQNVYLYGTARTSYALPLALYLIISESYNSTGVEVNFSYVILQNGSVVPPRVVTYDSVFISIPDLETAYIVVNDSTTPSINVTTFGGLFITTYFGHLLDAELVWGGYGNGESTNFLKMSSYLGLFYLSGNRFVPFTTVYDYGNDTAESTNDLRVTLANNGDAYVTVGTPDYGLLSDNFHPYIPGFTFVNVTSKVPFLVNGTLLTTRYVGYINSPITVSFFRNYSVNSSSFAVLSYPTSNVTILPSSSFENVTITPSYTYYYLVRVNSTIPVLLDVNGKPVLTNGSLWVPQGSQIALVNNTYYVSQGTRLVVTGTSPALPITVEGPATLDLSFIKEYLLEVNSTTPVTGIINNGQELELNGANWVPQGSQISLSVNLPFYEQGEFVGTYNVPPGGTIVVNGPTYERLVIYPNYYFIIAIIALVALGIAVATILRGKK